MAGFGSGWCQGVLKIPLGMTGIFLCSQGMLLKMLRGNGSGSDTRGQAFGGLGVGLAGLGLAFTREGINE